MLPDEPTMNGRSRGGELPEVTPPSPAFILQLFLVPGILVALIVAFIWVFFGWIGAGPQSAQEFRDALASENDLRRWKTAEHLAQVLQRDQQLAGNVQLALDLAEMLEKELKNPPPPVREDDPESETTADPARFLALTLARFQAPVGLPLFQKMIEQNQNANEVGVRLRLRDAIWAVGILGEQWKKLAGRSTESKDEILAGLKSEAGLGEGRQSWAQRALDALSGQKKPLGIAEALRPVLMAPDEMTRKFAAFSLAQWNEPGVDELLLQLVRGGDDITIFENSDHERGRREIRYNAALALARRGRIETIKPVLLETLDADRQRQLYQREGDSPKKDAVMADRIVLIALAAVQEMKENVKGEMDADVKAAVERLASHENPRVQAESRRALGSSAAAVSAAQPFSRDRLILIGVGAGIAFLLLIAVVARWRRSPAALATDHQLKGD